MLCGCGSEPKAAPVVAIDETKSAGYQKAVAQLAAMNRAAEAAYRNGKADEAAKIMDQEKPLVSRVLSPPRPDCGGDGSGFGSGSALWNDAAEEQALRVGAGDVSGEFGTVEALAAGDG